MAAACISTLGLGSGTVFGREPVAPEREPGDEDDGQADQHGNVESGIHEVARAKYVDAEVHRWSGGSEPCSWT